MILRCPKTECKHNTLMRIAAGAHKDDCCTLNDVTLTGNLFTDNLFCEQLEGETDDERRE